MEFTNFRLVDRVRVSASWGGPDGSHHLQHN